MDAQDDQINFDGFGDDLLEGAADDIFSGEGDFFVEHLLVHTGPLSDEKMSKAFFDDLRMPKPDINLEVDSGSHAEQNARIMVGFEKVVGRSSQDHVIVVGDVNSTMACTITAKKLGIKAGEYAILTKHRTGNVDDKSTLEGILEALAEIARKIPREIPIVFPIHPSTPKMAEQFGSLEFPTST